MQCFGHCGGHGTCINGMLCQCDEGYNGDRCVAIRDHPTFLKEDFECEYGLRVFLTIPSSLSNYNQASGLAVCVETGF